MLANGILNVGIEGVDYDDILCEFISVYFHTVEKFNANKDRREAGMPLSHTFF
jgi:hypothetical protein